MNGNKCGSCEYFEAAPEGMRAAAGVADAGQCKCNPPIATYAMQRVPVTPTNPSGQALVIQGLFPPVRANTDWCGKWSAGRPRLVS